MNATAAPLTTDVLRARIQRDFDRSGLMKQLGAQLAQVSPGELTIVLPYSAGVTQHLGYFHAGATTSIADSAGGFAAMTLVPEDQTVLTVEFKINFMAPAQGESLEAVAHVVRRGRTLTVVQVDVYALNAGERKAVALMQQTIANLPQPQA